MKACTNQIQFFKIRYIYFWVVVLICYLVYSQTKATSQYVVKATINTEQQSLHARVNISYLPTEPIDSLAFIIHENIVIKNCSVDGIIDFAEKTRGNNAKSAILYFGKKIKTPLEIQLEYTFTLKKGDAPWGIDKISEDWIELSLNSGWLPIISSFTNQFSSVTELDIVSEKKFDIVSSGVSHKLGDNSYKITNSIPQIDLVLIGSPILQKSTQDNITLYEHHKNQERQNFIFDISKKSRQWLNTSFGKIKKIPTAKLVIAPRNESGYARKNFIVLSNDISVKDTLHFVNYITHEFAHFWSNGANPLTANRWLDESIAEYIAWKYTSTYYSKSALIEFLNSVDKEADTLPAVYSKGENENQVPAHAVMYRKGINKMFKLERMIGEKKMFAFLSDWFKIEKKTSEKFLEHLENIAGLEIAQNFRLELTK